jgi:hypothetical protein
MLKHTKDSETIDVQTKRYFDLVGAYIQVIEDKRAV